MSDVNNRDALSGTSDNGPREGFAGGAQVNDTVTIDNGFVEARDFPNGPIDTTNHWIGRSESPQAFAYGVT